MTQYIMRSELKGRFINFTHKGHFISMEEYYCSGSREANNQRLTKETLMMSPGVIFSAWV